MLSRHLIQRTVPIGACAATILLLCAAPAASAGKRAVCTPAYAAYKDALESEKAGHLREARELLQTCMQATVCGGLVPKCTAKYNEIGTDMSSVVPVVTDEAGEPRVDVQVKVDGAPLCSRLDGKGLPVEPGVHEFTFSTDGGVFSTQKIMIVEGQRNRPISASLRSPEKGTHKTTVVASAAPTPQAASEPPAPDRRATEKPASEPPAPRESVPEEAAPQDASSESPPRGGRSLLLPLVLGGVGLAGLAAGGLLTYWGVKDNDALGQCKPSCPPSSVDHIRTLYLASDVSLGVGVAALGVATWLYMRSPSTEKPAPQTGYVFDLHPTPSGAFASVKGAF
jgi:hypothetical protein